MNRNLNDKIRYDGQIIQAEKPEYFILNKPKGFIADLKKKKITKSVDELIKLNSNNKLFFEQMSRICSGLLFFTNDLRLKNKLINSKKMINCFDRYKGSNISAVSRNGLVLSVIRKVK